MAAQVDIDDMASSLFQTNGHILPHFARLAEAMQQNNGRVIGRTNIVGLKLDACKALKFSYITKRHWLKPQILFNRVTSRQSVHADCIYAIIYARSVEITAIVMREMQTSLPASSSIRMDQICVVRPIDSDVAVAKTKPSFTGRIWLALISMPTVANLLGSTVIAAAVEPTVSAKTTDEPP